jgi:hypothetical protein
MAVDQLEWLARRDVAIVLGINPSAIAQSRLCAAEGHEAGALPRSVNEWLHATPATSATVFLHSEPEDIDSWYVACPDTWERDPACVDAMDDQASYDGFYDMLAGAASLAPYGGVEPDWTMLGGGFEGAQFPGLEGWPAQFGNIVLPDGAVPEALYFGQLSMNPDTPVLAGKELAPADARLRAGEVEVSTPATSWDIGTQATGHIYRPGLTTALPWLYETRSSGLMFRDFDQLATPNTSPWSASAWRGAEDPGRMTHADFALAEHYLVTRVLAHRDPVLRWSYLHLGDLSRHRVVGLHVGWVDCGGDCDGMDTELDSFIERLGGWPISWAP